MKIRANEITAKRTNKSLGNKGQLELSWVAVQNLSSRALEFKLPRTEARSGSGLAPNIGQIAYREFGQARPIFQHRSLKKMVQILGLFHFIVFLWLIDTHLAMRYDTLTHSAQLAIS